MGTETGQVSRDDREAFLHALDELVDALDVNMQRAERMKQRIADLQSALARGQALSEVVPHEEPPVLVELLTQSASNLSAYGSRVRRLEARALHQEGLTMEQIARLFRVTRQRVSALLRDEH